MGVSPAWLTTEIIVHKLMIYAFVALDCGWNVPIACSLRAFDGLICQPAAIIRLITNLAKPGDFILMHEGHSENVSTILGVVEELQRRGFSFVMVTDAQMIQG